MPGDRVPVAEVVVAHHVDQVEVLVHRADVVRLVDDGLRGPDGSRQDEVVLVEGRPEVPDQVDEISLVIGFATSRDWNEKTQQNLIFLPNIAIAR